MQLVSHFKPQLDGIRLALLEVRSVRRCVFIAWREHGHATLCRCALNALSLSVTFVISAPPVASSCTATAPL